MKKILEQLLAAIARAIIKKYRPVIIAITGSVGKTSAKDAIYCVVAAARHAFKSESSLNNELGVPLSIIGSETQGRNVIGWLGVYARSLWMLGAPVTYPEILVLEYGADTPGDIAHLISIAKPHIGVLTAIEKVHVEKFGSLDAIAQEKRSLITSLGTGAHAILNADNPLVLGAQTQTKATVITYGCETDAAVRATDVRVVMRDSMIGLSSTITYSESAHPLFIREVVMPHHVYGVLAAFAVGLALGDEPSGIIKSLEQYLPPKGRGRVIRGIRDSYILDDTYNASPASTIPALEALHHIPDSKAERRIAVIGDMMELGEYSVRGHREVGMATAREKIDFLVAVGERAADVAAAAREAGMPEASIVAVRSQDTAIAWLTKTIRSGDFILVKGSQGARMERIVRAIMRDTNQAHDLLVRQDARWLRK